MSRPLVLIAACLCLLGSTPGGDEVSLFDGKSLAGWKPSAEGADSFGVADGVLTVRGGRGHLFHVGADGKASFRDFELTALVRTRKGANSGIYFHTRFQDSGWPAAGYEAQVNATHGDRRKTGGLYGIADVMDAPAAPDDRWFEYRIRVEGRRIRLWVDGKPTADFTEPEDWTPPAGMEERRLGEGTFALQAHDPGCEVDYKDIRVRRLR